MGGVFVSQIPGVKVGVKDDIWLGIEVMVASKGVAEAARPGRGVGVAGGIGDGGMVDVG
jgi:hypothetical protein